MLIECIPNISEGRDRGKIELMSESIAAVSGVMLLDVNIDPDHNRTVFTFMGKPDQVESAALALCNMAITLIDMACHDGVHPRIGAVDVVPFVPLKGADMNTTVRVAHQFGFAFGTASGIPVYFYGEAALRPDRRELPAIRRGGYERLRERMQDPNWTPDAGRPEFDPCHGAVAVGARNPLIAFNINLAGDGNGDIARRIASEIRDSNGGLPCVRALGLFLKSRSMSQVSMNLLNYKITSISAAFKAVSDRAEKYGAEILDSELIGMIPEEAFQAVAAKELKIIDFGPDRVIENYYPE